MSITDRTAIKGTLLTKQTCAILPVSISTVSGLNFLCIRIGAKEVVALYSGVCKVNAAVAAQILIDRFAVDIIINSGTAGVTACPK